MMTQGSVRLREGRRDRQRRKKNRENRGHRDEAQWSKASWHSIKKIASSETTTEIYPRNRESGLNEGWSNQSS